MKEIRVAVLPFQILQDVEDLSPILLGFTEDLITNFSKFVGLSVISPYSTQHISDPSQQEEIDKLGAGYVVTGSFRRLGRALRIHVQLIRTEDHKVVFAQQYNEKPDSILQTQDTVTEQIVSVLQQQIDYDLLSYSYQKNTVQLAAYENWLMGMDSLRRGSLEHDLKARSYFEAALEIDPHYARAYAGLSLSYFNEWSCQLWDRWDISQKGAHRYALKALEFDENDYISLAVLGRTYLFSEKFDLAESCVRKSLRMNPNDSENLIQVAFTMMFLGLSEEALTLYHRAVELNPFHTNIYYAYGSSFYFELGQFEKCLELGHQVEFASCWVDFPSYMAAAYYYLSDEEQMWTYWQVFLAQFEEQIYTGKEPLAKEALEWQIRISPYRGKTNLQAFWDYLGAQQNGNSAPTPARQSVDQQAAFLRKAELWELSYQGQSVLVKDAKGYHDLARLLAAPEQEIHCAELMGPS